MLYQRVLDVTTCLSQDVLFKHIENILFKVGNVIDFEYNQKSFDRYRRRASEKSQSFEISEEFFDEIISQPCYICENEDCNGIDRFNNEIGYTNENCRPCCTTCNYMKKNLDYDLFMKHLKQMYTIMKQYVFENLNHTKIHCRYIKNKERMEEFRQNSSMEHQKNMENTLKRATEKLEVMTLGRIEC